MRSGSEEGSYLRLVDFCITELQAESNKEEEERRRRFESYLQSRLGSKPEDIVAPCSGFGVEG